MLHDQTLIRSRCLHYEECCEDCSAVSLVIGVPSAQDNFVSRYRHWAAWQLLNSTPDTAQTAYHLHMLGLLRSWASGCTMHSCYPEKSSQIIGFCQPTSSPLWSSENEMPSFCPVIECPLSPECFDYPLNFQQALLDSSLYMWCGTRLRSGIGNFCLLGL